MQESNADLGPVTTTRLLSAVAQAVPHARTQLLERSWSRLLRSAQDKVVLARPSDVEAQDLATAAFYEMIPKHAGSLTSSEEYFGKLRQRLKHRALDERRRTLRMKRVGGYCRQDLDVDSIEDQSNCDEPADSLTLEHVFTRFRTESPELACVFELLVVEGKTQIEASEALEIPLRTVERRWQSARTRLAWLLLRAGFSAGC